MRYDPLASWAVDRRATCSRINNEKLIHEVLLEGLNDWIPVDSLVGTVEDWVGDSPEQRTKKFSELLTCILESGLIEVGDLAEHGFSARRGSTQEIVAGVINELDSLNWDKGVVAG